MERKTQKLKRKENRIIILIGKNRYASAEPYSGETYVSEHFTSGELITKIIGEKTVD